jgi:hypothetical protein
VNRLGGSHPEQRDHQSLSLFMKRRPVGDGSGDARCGRPASAYPGRASLLLLDESSHLVADAASESFRRKAITRLMRGRVAAADDERERSPAVLLVDDSSSATGLRVAVGSAGGAWFRAARAGPTVFARVDRDALLPGAGAAVRGCGRRLRRWPGARRPGSRSRRAGRWRPGRPGRLWANGVMLRA